MACRDQWSQKDGHVEVLGDADFAGWTTTRKATVGRVAMWSAQFLKALSTTVRILALCSG